MDPVAQAEAPAAAAPLAAAAPAAPVETAAAPAAVAATESAPAPAATPAPAAASTSPLAPSLSLGRILHYCRHNGEHAPAIVTLVHNATCCNLTVFTDTDGVQRQTSVCQGDPHHVGTWHWPERV